jgi:hypothetical protein
MHSVFAQEAEDDLRRAFLEQIERGYFVEIGANHPQHLSQTFELEQRWWTGILVEPQPELAEALRGRRSARVFAEACPLS